MLLSYQNILRIDNLVGFDSLVKLQIDNNVIEKIENLGHLTSLEVRRTRTSPAARRRCRRRVASHTATAAACTL